MNNKYADLQRECVPIFLLFLSPPRSIAVLEGSHWREATGKFTGVPSAPNSGVSAGLVNIYNLHNVGLLPMSTQDKPRCYIVRHTAGRVSNRCEQGVRSSVRKTLL